MARFNGKSAILWSQAEIFHKISEASEVAALEMNASQQLAENAEDIPVRPWLLGRSASELVIEATSYELLTSNFCFDGDFDTTPPIRFLHHVRRTSQALALRPD
jgi:hypothetical protein